jgi:hypothetical protein
METALNSKEFRNHFTESEREVLSRAMLHSHNTALRHYVVPTALEKSSEALHVWNRFRKIAFQNLNRDRTRNGGDNLWDDEVGSSSSIGSNIEKVNFPTTTTTTNTNITTTTTTTTTTTAATTTKNGLISNSTKYDEEDTSTNLVHQSLRSSLSDNNVVCSSQKVVCNIISK